MTEAGTDWRMLEGVATAWFDAPSLVDDAGFPLLVDLRPGLVLIDSGEDQWEGAARQGGRPSSIRWRRRRRR